LAMPAPGAATARAISRRLMVFCMTGSFLMG
jgi:hypothetical protein